MRSIPALTVLLCNLAAGLGALSSNEMPLLPAADVSEKRIAAGETHRYGIRMKRGDYSRIEVHQLGIDLVASVLDPAGALKAEIDSPTDRFGTEVVSIVADAGGLYTVELAAGPAQREGGYRIEVKAQRPAEPVDAQRTTAEWKASAGYRRLDRRTEGDQEAAEELLREALAISREIADAPLEADIRYRLGMALMRRGDAEAALLQYETALALFSQAADHLGTMRALNQIGRMYRATAKFEKALAAFSDALSLGDRFGTPFQAATIHNNIGLVLHQTGRLRDALASYQHALEIFEKLEDRSQQANTSSNMAAIRVAQGRPVEAEQMYQNALTLARAARSLTFEANILNNLGDLYSASIQPRKALFSFSAALEIYRKLEDLPRQAATLNNLGSLLIDLGAAEDGRQLLLQALPNHREARHKATTHLNLARATRLLGSEEEALASFEQARMLHQEAGNRFGEAEALFFIGLTHLELRRDARARDELQRALALFRELGDRYWQVPALRALGQAQASLGDTASAEQSLQAALDLAGALDDSRGQSLALREQARLARDRGDLDAARVRLEASMERFESLRAEVVGARLRAMFLASVRESYEMYVDILLRLHENRPGEGFDARALAVAERSRARALLDFLARSEVEVAQGGSPLRADEQRIRQELAAKAALHMDLLRDETKAEEAEALEQEIESLLADYRLLEARLRAGDPRYAALKDPAIDLAAVQQLLDDQTVLLEYFLGETRSWLWVVTRDALKTFELPGRARIEELAVRVHQHLRSPNPTGAGDERVDLEELSRLLLGPALPEIEGRRMAIVADGALHYIPFAALPVANPDGGSVPLVVRHEIVHLPSAAVLREIRRAAAGRQRPAADLAILADPVYEAADPRVRSAAKKPATPTVPTKPATPETDILGALRGATRAESLARLSWSRREAERIVAAAEGREVLLALDFQASRDLALAPDLKRYKVLHFATHGFLDADHPELSGLALSQRDEQGEPRDGFLRLQDIYGLELQADLVVLSGCETALGQRIRGEGLLGLTHGFLHAGASGVVASLWEVRDRATAELMERFYRALYQDHLHPAAALRAAQVAMWKERAWRDPYYWAAFTMQGDGLR